MAMLAQSHQSSEAKYLEGWCATKEAQLFELPPQLGLLLLLVVVPSLNWKVALNVLQECKFFCVCNSCSSRLHGYHSSTNGASPLSAICINTNLYVLGFSQAYQYIWLIVHAKQRK